MKNHRELIDIFSTIDDPRVDRMKKHKLIDIIVLAVLGIISGCETFVDIENYCKSKSAWLKNILGLKNGIPSHDTIGRVFSLIDPKQLQSAFYEWAKTFINIDGEIINIDGKLIRGSQGSTKNKNSIFGMVNAWASTAGLALGHCRTDFDKKNEQSSFRELIEFLELEGALVTMDANGCYASIGNKINDKGGDYLIALKGNQRGILKNVKGLLCDDNLKKEEHQSSNRGHGRDELRKCTSGSFPKKLLEELQIKDKKNKRVWWSGLCSFCKIESSRIIKGKKTSETRYYLSSLEPDPVRMLNAVRSHWKIENNLHWTLDVSFNEDRCRVRKGFAGENFATIRQLALNLLIQEKSTRKSIKSKRLTCGWENEYLLKVVSGVTKESLVI